MRFLDRIRYQGAPKTPQEADRLALRQLSGRGADLAKPRHVIHFLYFAGKKMRAPPRPRSPRRPGRQTSSLRPTRSTSGA